METLFKKSFSLMDRMTDREKYRTYGGYYMTVARAYQEAINNFKELVKQYPADRAGHADLAVAYFYTLDFGKAFESGRRALELYPSSLKQRNNAALYAMYSGNFEAAAREAAQVSKADPALYRPYVPLAIAAIATSPASARPIYERMRATGVKGASLAATGLADLAMYEGRYDEAVRVLTPAVEVDRLASDKYAMATKHVMLAEAFLALGNSARAAAAVQHALAASRVETVVLPAARVLASFDRNRARALAKELRGQTQGYSRAYAEIVDAELALARGAPADAVDSLRLGQRTADPWLLHFQLGVAYTQARRYPEAIVEFDRCTKRRGEATAIFLDDVPSFRYLATLPYWRGRAQEGLENPAQARQNYEQYLMIRSAAGDAITRDARTRVSLLP